MGKKYEIERLPPPKLVVPRDEAATKIQMQIEKGQQIESQPFRNYVDLAEADSEFKNWSSYNEELLTRLFNNASIADEYRRCRVNTWFKRTFEREVQFLFDSINAKVTVLEGIFRRLELIPESEPMPTLLMPASNTLAGRDIFIVHGHDSEAKLAVARFLEKLDLNPVILHERASKGQTIIEKLEGCSQVSFAVVLLIPDDLGEAKANVKRIEDLKPRARQNVVLELGYFIAKLGRERVCALYKEGIEIPSDYHGVLFVKMDDGGAWQMELAREIRQVGISIDMNEAI